MMLKQWLYDNPWIWIVVLLVVLIVPFIVTVFIAELNKPEILPH